MMPTSQEATVAALKTATRRVVAKPWKKEPFEVYLQLDETPGRIVFSGSLVRKSVEGTASPVEWRLENEFGAAFNLSGSPAELVDYWVEAAEEVSEPAGVSE